ncbi:uncharacterized protein [Eurosta solidaginis]|uniref:uncharacterized protein n=1 Tax=Eurosta solidaginis TaxID=178769 RepID=UPI003530AA1E
MILAAISAQTSTVTLMSSQIQMSSQLEEQKTYMTSQLAEQLKAQETRISEMSTQITSKMEAQEERLSLQVAQMYSQLEAQNTKIVQLEDKMDAEIETLRGRIQELQLNRPAVSASNPKVFKVEFEKTAAVNNWNAEDKVAALFVALKGPPTEIL